MKGAMLSAEGQYKFDGQVDSRSTFQFNQAQFIGESHSEIADLTLDTLKGVEDFDLNVTLSGEALSPDTSIRSNLDKRLNKAFKQAVKRRWAEVEKDTKQALAAKLKSSLDLNEGDLKKLKELDLSLDNVEQKLKDYGQSEFAKLVKNKKDEYEKELADKAKAELAKKEAQAKAELKKKEEELKEKAKAEEEKLKDKLEDKLKDKLKDFKCCE